MSVLRLKDVSVRYAKSVPTTEYLSPDGVPFTELWALRGVSLTLERGDILGVLGAHGAGKSALLRLLAGVSQPAMGTVERPERVSAVLDLAGRFDSSLTVRENIYLRCFTLGLNRAFTEGIYDSVISFAHLDGLDEMPFSQLTSKRKLRLAVSLALLSRPQLLLFDRLPVADDPEFRISFEDALKQFAADGGGAVLVCRDFTQALRVCSRALWLDGGRPVLLSSDVEDVCRKFLESQDAPGPEQPR